MKDKNDNSKLINDKKKHNNKRVCDWFRIPAHVIPPNFGSKGRKKLKR